MSEILIPQFLLRLREGRYDPRDSFRGMHHHAEWQWDYLHAGASTIRLPNATVHLRPHQAILLPPNLPHELGWQQDSVYSSFKFHWPGAPANANRAEPLHLPAADMDPRLVQGLLASAQQVDPAAACASACWMHLLLHAAINRQSPSPTTPPIALTDQVAAQLAASGFRPLSLTKMARACHLSTAQFLRRFQQVSGTTPAKFVLRLRLTRAEALMRHADMNISQVAQALGWPDVFSFSKAYKRHRGHSPKKFLSTP